MPCEYLGMTVESNQGYWYEVHPSDREDADVHLIPIDRVTDQYVSNAELEDRMNNGWEIVYDGTTGLHGDNGEVPV